MSSVDALLVLVPGAWMGAWIWDNIIDRLADQGLRSTSVTLAGLEPGRVTDEVAAVRLEDHVTQVVDLAQDQPEDSIVLVGHSYSGMVTGQVADRIPRVVRRSVHIATFLPRDGRSLIDDWGPDPEARQAERDQIRDGGRRIKWTKSGGSGAAELTDAADAFFDGPHAEYLEGFAYAPSVADNALVINAEPDVWWSCARTSSRPFVAQPQRH